jgi:hypothetical protein
MLAGRNRLHAIQGIVLGLGIAAAVIIAYWTVSCSSHSGVNGKWVIARTNYPELSRLLLQSIELDRGRAVVDPGYITEQGHIFCEGTYKINGILMRVGEFECKPFGFTLKGSEFVFDISKVSEGRLLQIDYSQAPGKEVPLGATPMGEYHKALR